MNDRLAYRVIMCFLTTLVLGGCLYFLSGCTTIVPSENLIEQREIIVRQDLLLDDLEESNMRSEEILRTMTEDPRVEQLLILNKKDLITINTLRETIKQLEATNKELLKDLSKINELNNKIKELRKWKILTIISIILIVIIITVMIVLKIRRGVRNVVL